MKRLASVAKIAGLLAAGATSLWAQVPGLLHYQGQVAVSGTNFTGPGQFKFALVDAAGTNTFWSNDGSSAGGLEPAAAVTLSVSQGFYAVLLGDTNLANLTPIPPAVFTNASVWLRVWFNDGSTGFQHLLPDARIAAVGYAMMATTVPDGAVTAAKLAPGAVSLETHVSGVLPDSLLSANILRTTSNPVFTGTVAAARFVGDGSGLSNVSQSMPWQSTTGLVQQAEPNRGYLASFSNQVTLALPSEPAFGDVVRVGSASSGGWKVAQNDGQWINTQGLNSRVAGWQWTALTNSGLRLECDWVALTASADGARWLAAARDVLFVSQDYGCSWSQVPYRVDDVQSACGSSDGQLLFLGTEDHVHRSYDYGATWQVIVDRGVEIRERVVACSADARVIYGADGYAIRSLDSGRSWSDPGRGQLEPLGSFGALSIALSSNGTRGIACRHASPGGEGGDHSGILTLVLTNWSEFPTGSPPDIRQEWERAVCSEDGALLMAGSRNGRVFTAFEFADRSTNRVTRLPGSPPITGLACARNGSVVIAVTDTGPLYVSFDQGQTWLDKGPQQRWRAVACSADGGRITAACNQGLYVASPSTTTGALGGLKGNQQAAIELQYVGAGQWQILSHKGAIEAF